MGITCGCGAPEANHGNPRHITLSQFRQAAEAAQIDMDQLLKKIVEGFRRFARVRNVPKYRP